MTVSPERTATSSARSRKIAYWLDSAFRVPGTEIRFGLDPLMGLVPGLGDVVGGLLSAYIVVEAARAGASAAVILRMLANLGLDMLLAAVPLLGDLFDAGFKANTRNMALLQHHLDRPEEAHAASRTFLVLACTIVGVFAVGTAILAAFTLQWLLNALAF
jgi:hypothetical protein